MGLRSGLLSGFGLRRMVHGLGLGLGLSSGVRLRAMVCA